MKALPLRKPMTAPPVPLPDKLLTSEVGKEALPPLSVKVTSELVGTPTGGVNATLETLPVIA